MTWIIDNIWPLTGAFTAFTTNVIALAVGWTKLNGKVEDNTKGIQLSNKKIDELKEETNDKIDELKNEVRSEQKQIAEEMKGFKATQIDMLQQLSAISASIKILIDKK